MQNNVNVDELNGVALEIAKSIQQLNQSISDFKETSNSIKGQCETLNGYNGQKVAGTTTKEQVYDDKGYSSTIETYKIWDIEGQVPLESDCNTLEQELDDMEESISNLKLEASDLELIADTIEGYIKSIQDELGEDIDPSILAGAFGVLEGGIAYDSYSAGTGNFISSKHILSEYWTDKTLRFERNSNGTYTIYQKDKNGKEVVMGYTTALTAALYMKELKNKVNGNQESNSDQTEPSGHENDPRYDAPDDNDDDQEPSQPSGHENDPRYFAPDDDTDSGSGSEPSGHENDPRYDAPDDSEPVVPKGNETDDRYGPPDNSEPSGHENDPRYDAPDDSEPVVPKGNETDDRYGQPDNSEPSGHENDPRYDAPDDSEPVVPKGNETDDRYGPPDNSEPSGHENDPRYDAPKSQPSGHENDPRYQA